MIIDHFRSSKAIYRPIVHSPFRSFLQPIFKVQLLAAVDNQAACASSSAFSRECILNRLSYKGLRGEHPGTSAENAVGWAIIVTKSKLSLSHSRLSIMSLLGATVRERATSSPPFALCSAMHTLRWVARSEARCYMYGWSSANTLRWDWHLRRKARALRSCRRSWRSSLTIAMIASLQGNLNLSYAGQ